MNEARVLIVEDDRGLRTVLKRALTFEGYDVVETHDGAEGLEALSNANFDVVILDIGLPNIDGLSLCRMLRAKGRSEPVMMLTARTEISDRVAGLDAGADDYLAKPFSVEELLARVRALLRRPPTGDSQQPSELAVASLALDSTKRSVSNDGEPVELTKLEFDLLEYLMINKNIVVTRDTLYEQIWGYDFETGSRALDVSISYLRSKLESNSKPRLIQTVRGIGYVIRPGPQ